ncbi:MAG: DUF4280 domain-containing protein [Selenomonas sp.]|uniref:PAAR-like protein n=1 Tax=Selenomonas sp. TaxID=2053611 RepID=UPI002600952D|nr:PAAR-like protein [Selenomonas sp.]MCR5439563.1 DUF4280 domain-containing protein [Selenomonas sp.]
MTDEKELMTEKRFTFCDKGSLRAVIKTIGHGMNKNGERFLNANDHIVGKNILCYGYCKCLGGICRPNTPSVWIDVDDDSLGGGAPHLTSESRLPCMNGGFIHFCDNNAYGVESFLRDLFAGKYSASFLMKSIAGNKLLASYLDFSAGVEGGKMALIAATELMAAQTSMELPTRTLWAKRMGVGLLGLHSVATLMNSGGEFLEGIGLGEHDYDVEKLFARTLSPQYGELVYSAFMAKGSAGKFAKTKNIKDGAGAAKDINDVDDAWRKYNEGDNSLKYVNNNNVEDAKYNINNINIMQDIYVR